MLFISLVYYIYLDRYVRNNYFFWSYLIIAYLSIVLCPIIQPKEKKRKININLAILPSHDNKSTYYYIYSYVEYILCGLLFHLFFSYHYLLID